MLVDDTGLCLPCDSRLDDDPTGGDVMVTGTNPTYIAGTGHVPLPMATDVGVRKAHEPRPPRPTGLDWDKLRPADEPTEPEAAVTAAPACTNCRHPAVTLVDGLCINCQGVVDSFTAPDPTHGRIDRDIQEHVDTMQPTNLGQRVANENTLQAQRDDGRAVLGRNPATKQLQVEQRATPVHVDPPATEAAVSSNPVTEYVAYLLDDTSASDDPVVQMLRSSALSVLAALDYAHHPPTSVAASAPRAASSEPAPVERNRDAVTDPQTPVVAATPGATTPVERSVADKATTGSTTPRRRRVMGDWTGQRRPRSSSFDLEAAKRMYVDEGKLCRDIAAALGCSQPTVRKHLQAAGVKMRNDRGRHGNQVGHSKTYDPELVDQVRRLYVDEELTQAVIAHRIGTSVKVVQNVMTKHGIAARPAAHIPGSQKGVDRAQPLKERIAALGATSIEVKTWALEQGLVDRIQVGLPAARLVDAYAAAHPVTEADS